MKCSPRYKPHKKAHTSPSEVTERQKSQKEIQSQKMVKSRTVRYLALLVLLVVSVARGQSPAEGDLRLVNGDTAAEGRVEIYHAGRWGTVCDDRFGTNDGRVVCRQLGFESLVRVRHRAAFGAGSRTMPIWMDGLECIGNENKLSKCKFNNWSIHDCSHNEDVGVVCKRPDNPTPDVKRTDIKVRLSCPPSSANADGDCNVCFEKNGCPSSSDKGVKGIVEAFIRDEWHPVSGEKWDFAKSTVVCGQLGYPTALPIPTLKDIWPSNAKHFCYRNSRIPCTEGANYKLGLRSTVLDDLQCSGRESNLTMCYHQNLSIPVTERSTENVAIVHCGYSTENSEHCFGDDLSKEVYRLRAGVTPYMGRVEVRRNGKWGTICDLGWDLDDANIVCRNLGYGTAKKIFSRSHFGRGINEVHYSNLRCRGQSLLSNCPRTPDNRVQSEVLQYCRSHTGDVGVECYVPSQCPKRNSSDITASGVIRVNGPQGMGGVCLGAVNIDAANVVCREDRVQFASDIRTVQSSSYSGRLYKGKITCTGEEASISDCRMQLSTTNTCSDGIAGVVCSAKLPDLVPNLRQFEQSLRNYPYVSHIPKYYLRCALEEKCVASSAHAKPITALLRLLRFDSLTMNYGTADFTPKLDRSQWIWHECHRHYHSYENFITYDVLNPAGQEVAEGHKASFCLEDSRCDPGASPRFSCTVAQGISINCGDLYARHLDCQWIDISDQGDGNYLLRQTVNADKITPETDYKNNEIECEIKITNGYYIQKGDCRHSDH